MASEVERVRLDLLLVRRGLVRSREQATALIRAGAVTSDGQIASKPSTPTADDAALEVELGPDDRWVSRGALKLVGALDALPQISLTGKRCLDAGASTGGFTQVLLDRGAAIVDAVDVGHDQLAAPLRADPRVRVYEGLHIRDLDVAGLGGPADLVVADLSFISLLHVLPMLAAATADDGDLLPMVKPQFEVGAQRLGRGGVVRNPLLRRTAVEGVVTAAAKLGFGLAGLVESPITGPAGNVEYFVWLRRGVKAVDFATAWDSATA